VSATTPAGFPPYPAHDLARRAGYLLVGPTGSGKSAVAQSLAETDGLGILSTDSMLVYRDMNVGTDKPCAAWQRAVPYWGLDLASPGSAFSAGLFLKHAAKAFAEAGRTRTPLIAVGGTGLYIDTLLHGLDAGGPADVEARSTVERIEREAGLQGLQEALCARDPERFEALQDPANPRRVIRALELSLMGHGGPSARNREDLPPIPGLRLDPALLRERIAARVNRMFEGGLIDEVRRLRDAHGAFSLTAGKGIGYAEAAGVLDGDLAMAEAQERTIVRTRRLAKRQMTWFRHQCNVQWIDVHSNMSGRDLAGAVRHHWQRHGPTPMAAT
jgi:tRNA dimethylallyltransferase